MAFKIYIVRHKRYYFSLFYKTGYSTGINFNSLVYVKIWFTQPPNETREGEKIKQTRLRVQTQSWLEH